MMMRLYSSCPINISDWNQISNLTSVLGYVFGFYVFFVGFSSVMMLLHFNNYVGLSLWYLQQSPLVWNMCYTTHLLSLSASSSRYSSGILYVFGKMCTFSKTLKYNLRVYTQIQVHCIHAFSFSILYMYLCIYLALIQQSTQDFASM